MSAFFRCRVEATIEHMIALLDEMDGDPNMEAEPVEEQHDRESVDLNSVIERVTARAIHRSPRLVKRSELR
ncbi:hypothetical protein EOA13_33895 [Mesorhizobium sp. M7A.F.Ca.US.011.01.1.1]|uniref:hypothetical protein n=1 Tax=Mesorhizobium sp. M7A.F.Ca.US.011.01.1.1 TaxID=2496741 RepID=UPI000FC9A065|nr:hypothetical protein [Mesorhizobium sp. M7A.F.Ca.US.011.01.1.1]RUX23438.1 hypothetical protein EOA13_33895 [Mesorhizobium sp. M7A.F.Ca.US.011.01.1.1]